MKYVALLLGIILCALSEAQTIRYTDGSQTDVAAKIAAAISGDTIDIPEGTFEWNDTNYISVTKAITIRGQGVGVTKIIDGYTDNTQTAIMWLACTTGKLRVTGIEFIADSPIVTAFEAGVLAVGGCTNLELDHLKFSAGIGRRAIWPFGSGSGLQTVAVVHNCEFAHAPQMTYMRPKDDYGDKGWSVPVQKGSANQIFFEDITTSYASSSGSNFDGDGGGWVTVRFCTLTNSKYTFHGTESSRRSRGGRWLEYYGNVVTGSAVDSVAVDMRSGAGYFFNNYIASTRGNIIKLNSYRHLDFFIPWGVCDGTNPFDINFTDDGPSTPGGAGDGVYESGTSTGGGFKVISDTNKNWIPGEWVGYTLRSIRFTGTVSSGGLRTFTISPSPGWTANQMTGYAVRRKSTNDFAAIASHTADTVTTSSTELYPVTFAPGDQIEFFTASAIISNTETSLSTDGNFGFSGTKWFTHDAGLSYEIRKAVGIDHNGNSHGNDLVGTTSLAAQASGQTVGGQPVREWSNIHTGAPFRYQGYHVEGRDFYAEAGPFNGSAGNGVGTRAQMDAITPSKTGVAFWVIDEGTWNTTFSGTKNASEIAAGYVCEIMSVGTTDFTIIGSQANTVGTTFKATGAGTGTGTVRPMQGRLYVWDGDSWNFDYEPYTYPHPNRSDVSPDTEPPVIISASVNGGTVTIISNESLTGGAAAQFSISAGSLSGYSVANNTITMTLSPAAAYGEPTYTINYAPGTIEDVAGNAMESQSGIVVINNTPENSSPSVRNPGRKAKAGRVLTR